MTIQPKEKRTDLIDKHRRSKPLSELARKARKAKRRGIWTQEEIDFGKVHGQMLADFFKF